MFLLLSFGVRELIRGAMLIIRAQISKPDYCNDILIELRSSPSKYNGEFIIQSNGEILRFYFYFKLSVKILIWIIEKSDEGILIHFDYYIYLFFVN